MRTADQPIRISLFAPKGRMGKAIAAAVELEPNFELDAEQGEVLLDFSDASALSQSLELARLRKVPIVVGTTGLGEQAERQMADAANEIAVLHAPNTSLGIALLETLVEKAAHVLGSDWDIEIAEIHHRLKTDSPSGTALLLGQAAARGRNSALTAETARSGNGLKREAGAIGFASLRGGTVAGDHDVLFLGPDERLVLSHHAESRAIFARGALAAARFIVRQPAGLYLMRDVVSGL
jgi:4-hydroxy-tetrahydrodipicolinate reductase